MNKLNIFELSYPHSLQKSDLPETVTAIGFFDGIHIGHQTVINHAIKEAKRKEMESAVITFHPHPSVVLKNNTDVKYITPMEQKKLILQELGVDRLYIIHFNKELSSLVPQLFIDHFIVGLNIKHVVAGFDYSFGHMGKGNMENIGDYAKGRFSHSVINKVTHADEKISSTRIRRLLKTGEVEQVNELLARPFTTVGIVVEGDKRGREMGFPTANVKVNGDSLLPKSGIYAVKVRIDDEIYHGMASLGTNPTVTADRKDLSLEVNILDYNSDIYGKELYVEWYHYIRDEIKFENLQSLIKEINNDERKIRQYFSI